MWCQFICIFLKVFLLANLNCSSVSLTAGFSKCSHQEKLVIIRDRVIFITVHNRLYLCLVNSAADCLMGWIMTVVLNTWCYFALMYMKIKKKSSDSNLLVLAIFKLLTRESWKLSIPSLQFLYDTMSRKVLEWWISHMRGEQTLPRHVMCCWNSGIGLNSQLLSGPLASGLKKAGCWAGVRDNWGSHPEHLGIQSRTVMHGKQAGATGCHQEPLSLLSQKAKLSRLDFLLCGGELSEWQESLLVSHTFVLPPISVQNTLL